MKKYFLKGKQFITKKLEEFDIETQNIDYVRQQIPTRLKQPLNALLADQIDLQPTSLYHTYFRNYPTHHLSQYLLEKYNLQLQANLTGKKYKLPKEDVFVAKFDQQLQNKALLLKEIIDQYDEGYSQLQDTVICMCVIHFHHKRGTQIQYSYPKNPSSKSVEESIVHHAMPDSSHNKHEDYNFYNFQAEIKGKKRMLFGVSYFKQIKVTEQMKNNNKQLTRSYIQKAVAVVSLLPLFGYLKFRLAVTTKLFFDKFTNFQIIDAAYHDISKHLNQTWPNMTMNELYIGTDLKVIIDLFGVQQFYEIWKAVLYQRRVVVFAHSSSSASSFILSLLSLFPGLTTFGMFSKPISRYMQSLRQYDLPLRMFSSDNFLSMSFHIQDFYQLAKFQKSNDGHFLVGTTNRLLKEANDYGVQMLINLQNCTIQKKKSRIGWQQLSKKEKTFLCELDQIINKQKNIGYGGSQDCIRNHFHKLLKDQLLQIIQAIHLFKKFVKQCEIYENNSQNKSPVKKNQSSYQQMQQQDQSTEQQNKVNDDFPPIIPRQVINIPFPSLLLQKSFTHFLQFHNPNLPNIIKNKHQQLSLYIENNDYIASWGKLNFITYNIAENRLYFGKGTPTSYEGKEIRFYNNTNSQIQKAKSIFVGVIENNKFCKHGFYVDENQTYEGDYENGAKNGYGKLSNTIHKYIGFFENNLYSGDGQLVIGDNVYVGQFREGLKHGCGKNQNPHQTYDGQWQNDYPHGEGVLVYKQIDPQTKLQKLGNQYIGKFIKGQLDENSQITIRYANNSMYKGEVKNKIPNGKGSLIDENGIVTQGTFLNGKILPQTKQDLDTENNIEKQQQTKQQIKQKNNQEVQKQNSTQISVEKNEQQPSLTETHQQQKEKAQNQNIC